MRTYTIGLSIYKRRDKLLIEILSNSFAIDNESRDKKRCLVNCVGSQKKILWHFVIACERSGQLEFARLNEKRFLRTSLNIHHRNLINHSACARSIRFIIVWKSTELYIVRGVVFLFMIYSDRNSVFFSLFFLSFFCSFFSTIRFRDTMSIDVLTVRLVVFDIFFNVLKSMLIACY